MNQEDISVDEDTGDIIGKAEQPAASAPTQFTSYPVFVPEEVDQQVSTAKRYPRSIQTFRDGAKTLATSSKRMAEDCLYTFDRGGKSIVGPGARFAEILAMSWGNCRVGARIVREERDHVVAQGVFHDVERNMIRTSEVRRRITDKHGKRFNADMVAVTSNAACSIAARNAVLAGIPKPYWAPVYEKVLGSARGSETTLDKRRNDALEYFKKLGIRPERVFLKLGVKGADDIGLEQITALIGLVNAIKDGEQNIDDMFQEPKSANEAVPGKVTDTQAKTINEALKAAEIPEQAFLFFFAVESVSSLPKNRYQEALEWIERKPSK